MCSKGNGEIAEGFKQGCYALTSVLLCSHLCCKKVPVASPRRMDWNVKVEARHSSY